MKRFAEYRGAVTAALSFAVLMVAFWFVGAHFHVTENLTDHLPSAILSFALLLAPYWGFGFGLDSWLRRKLIFPWARILAPALLITPYLVFVLPRGQFRWDMCLGMLGAVLAIAVLLEIGRSAAPEWRDWLALAILGIAVGLHLFDKAWAAPGLAALPKLLFVDAGLYGFLVLRPIGGIGYDFRARLSDFRIGLREFLWFTPIALAFGLLTSFLHVHPTWSDPVWFCSGWLFTLIFIAMPEELFFRGLIMNLLERRVGMRRALWITSVLFGLAHFNKRTALFNWRYVILAAIAGVFYGRAWLAQRRLLASSITHATVDTVWSIWLR
jgi:membrane protease YdiL (CAAX protease family)